MCCQMETLVYLTDTGRERLNLRSEGPAAAFCWSHRVPNPVLKMIRASGQQIKTHIAYISISFAL